MAVWWNGSTKWMQSKPTLWPKQTSKWKWMTNQPNCSCSHLFSVIYLFGGVKYVALMMHINHLLASLCVYVDRSWSASWSLFANCSLGAIKITGQDVLFLTLFIVSKKNLTVFFKGGKGELLQSCLLILRTSVSGDLIIHTARSVLSKCDMCQHQHFVILINVAPHSIKHDEGKMETRIDRQQWKLLCVLCRIIKPNYTMFKAIKAQGHCLLCCMEIQSVLALLFPLCSVILHFHPRGIQSLPSHWITAPLQPPRGHPTLRGGVRVDPNLPFSALFHPSLPPKEHCQWVSTSKWVISSVCEANRQQCFHI